MHRGDGFSAKTLGKSQFHYQTDWSGNGQASQLWQMLFYHGYSNSFNLLLCDYSNRALGRRSSSHTFYENKRFSSFFLQTDQFKVDRLQIIVVAKKYIYVCVQFHNWFIHEFEGCFLRGQVSSNGFKVFNPVFNSCIVEPWILLVSLEKNLRIFCFQKAL